MFCVLLFVFLISGGFTQDPELDEEDLTAERNNYTCAIPPSDTIRNGRFRVEGYGDDEQPPAGKKTYSYVLQVTCNTGFNLKGWYLVQCITGKSTDEFPECLPTCKRSSPDVFTDVPGTGFGTGEARCLAPRDNVDKISTRRSFQLQCGVTPKVFRTSVVNGREANREEVPWHAGIYTKTTRPYMQICGGTIISNNVVISAAHCFWRDVEKLLPAENYAVAVRKLFRPWNDTNDPNAQKFDVQEIRIPPRFQGSATNFQDDIALLILASVIKLSEYVTPACLDFQYDFDARQLAQGKLGRVSGWGLDSEDGPSSQVLNVVELPVVSIEQCIAGADPGFLPSITSDKICAGYTNGTAVCKGDSGGGLVIPEVVDGVTKYYLRGIVSTAPRSDHLCNIYAAATFTHVLKHQHFIMEAINQIPSINQEPKISPTVTTFPPIIDSTKAANIISDDNRNIEVITKNATNTIPTEDDTNIDGTSKNLVTSEDSTFIQNTTQNTLSPLPLTNLNSSHSKEKLNTSANTSNPDEDFREIIADLENIPQTNDKGIIATEKVALEPITNPPVNDNENIEDTNEEDDISDVEEENIGTNVKESFETVNSNQNSATDSTKESSEDTESNINVNIPEIPALGIPIGITIGQTDETVNSDENLGSSLTDEGSPTDVAASAANDQQEDTSAEALEEEESLKPVNPTVPASDKLLEINAGTVNPNANPVTVKESSINDDSITIWPSTPGAEPADYEVDYTQTTSILEDYWVTAGPDYYHNAPGHSHHHWPYYHWQKHSNGPSSHQTWHKQPSWQNHYHNRHNWQDWNRNNNWQRERFQPFLEYHHHQHPSKPAPNYVPWFNRFRK